MRGTSLVISVLVDGLAPSGARSSVGILLIAILHMFSVEYFGLMAITQTNIAEMLES